MEICIQCTLELRLPVSHRYCQTVISVHGPGRVVSDSCVELIDFDIYVPFFPLSLEGL